MEHPVNDGPCHPEAHQGPPFGGLNRELFVHKSEPGIACFRRYFDVSQVPFVFSVEPFSSKTFINKAFSIILRRPSLGMYFAMHPIASQ
jgi:hypothetical protein